MGISDLIGFRRMVLLLFAWVHTGTVLAQDSALFFEKVTTGFDSPRAPIYGIQKDKLGFMWFGTWDGLYRYDGLSFKRYEKDSPANSYVPSNRIRTIFKDNQSDLFVLGFNQSYARYNPRLDIFEDIRENQHYNLAEIDSLSQLSLKNGKKASYQQTRWTVENDRLWETNLQTGESHLIAADLNTPGSLSDDFVSWIYLDDQQILWVGLQNGDINKADLRRKPFHFQYNRVYNEGRWKDSPVRAIWDDGSRLWIASNNRGVSVVDQQTNVRYELGELFPAARNLARVRTMVSDKKGNVWFGNHEGIHCLNPETKKFRSYRPREFSAGIANNSVFVLKTDASGNLWAGLYNGFARYVPEQDQFETFDLAASMNDHSVMDLLVDEKENIWLATEGDGLIGLKNKLSEAGWQDTVWYRSVPDDSKTIPGNQVYSLYEDNDGLIWLGTSEGACFVDQNGAVNRLNESTGLSDQYISYITGDISGNLWIAHKNGLTRYIRASGEVRHFSGFLRGQSTVFLDKSGTQNAGTGTIYLGTQTGVLHFKPNEININPDAPLIRFTQLNVQSEPVAVGQAVGKKVLLSEALPYTSELTLSYWERSFSFSFAALHFSEPLNNRYACKLENFDADWVYADAQHTTAGYSNLPPGTYTLRVKAANPDGIWSEQDAQVQIIIRPPFWATVPAYIVYALLMAGLLVWIYFYLISKVNFKNQLAMERLEKQKALEVDKAKLEFYTNVSHELRTPLSLIIDPVEKLQEDDLPPAKQRDYTELIHRNALRLLRLINQLLDFRKIETDNETLNLTTADWVEFSRNIVDSFKLHASQRNIAVRFQSSVPSFFGQLDEDKLEKILVNLLSNAIKYTPDGGQVDVDVEVFDGRGKEEGGSNRLFVTVQDSGIGIPQKALRTIFDPFARVKGNKAFEGESSGIGLALTKKLVELMEGRITVESEPGKGSRFGVEIPVAEKKLPEESNLLAENTDAETSGSNAGSKPLILLVDDNEEILHYLESEMQDQYTVMTARDGKEAKQIATTWVPDLVVSDVVMPETDGFEFCKKLKSDIRTSHIPVILLTARQAQSFKIEGLDKGADAYLTKPFNTSILKAQIRSLINNRQKIHLRYSENSEQHDSLAEENDLERDFLKQAIQLVEANLATEGFNSEALADQLHLGQRQLYRKLHALTGQTVHQFMTTIRLNVAKESLLQRNKSISEVAFEVGYTEVSNFSRSFSKQFGKSPSQFLAEN